MARGGVGRHAHTPVRAGIVEAALVGSSPTRRKPTVTRGRFETGPLATPSHRELVGVESAPGLIPSALAGSR